MNLLRRRLWTLPVTLVAAWASGAWGGLSTWWSGLDPLMRGLILAGCGTSLLLVVCVWWLLSRHAPVDPADKPYKQLARGAGLTRSERRALRQLAESTLRISPSALIISTGAMRAALRQAGDDALPLATSSALLRVADKLLPSTADAAA